MSARDERGRQDGEGQDARSSTRRFLATVTAFIDRLRPGRIIAAAVLARLLFGLAWMLFVNVPPENVPVAGDTWAQAGADGYLQIARTLLVSGEYAFEPGGPPVHNRPPLPVALLLVFGAWLPAQWYLVWMAGSALLSLAMLAALRALARDLDLSPRAERLTLLLAGFHPYMVFISKTTTFINAAALLLVVVVLLVFRLRRAGRLLPQYAVLAGLAMGAGALTHGTFLLLPLLAVPYLLSLREHRMSRRLLAATLVAGAALLVVAPWTLRNLQTFDRMIPVVTGNGYHYWKGEAVYFGGDYPMAALYEEATGKPFEERYYGAVDPAADAVLWDLAKKDMIARPARIPLRLAVGTFSFLAPWDSSRAKAVVSGVLNIPLALALLALFLRAWRRHTLTREQFALMLLLLYVVEAFAFFVAWGSYFTMLLPIALLLLVSFGKNR